VKLVHEEFEDLRLAITGGGTAVFLACATCGEKIVGQDAGIVVFDRAVDGTRTGSFTAIHKSTCETAETSALPWQDLDTFLRDVVLNTQIDLEETERKIGKLADFGLHL